MNTAIIPQNTTELIDTQVSNPTTFTLTKVASANCDLRKIYEYKDDAFIKTNAADMYKGHAQSEIFSGLDSLNAFLDGLKKNEAILSGVFPTAECIVVSKRNARPSEGVYSRSLDYVDTPKTNYIQLLDNDPHPKGVTFKSAQECLDYMHSVDPVFKELEIIVRPSSSAGVNLNGNYRDNDISWHAFVVVSPDVKPVQFKEYLNFKLWEKGDGYIAFGKNGSKLKRATFDMAVFSPERLIFEAKPLLKNGLKKTTYANVYQKGRALALSDVAGQYKLKAEALTATALVRDDVLAESDSINTQYIADETAKYQANGLSDEEIKSLMQKMADMELSLDMEVVLDDGQKITVKEMCCSPHLYNERALADPVEGVEYGTSTAKFYWNGGNPVIKSFAHSDGVMYRLKQPLSAEYITEETLETNELIAPGAFPNARVSTTGSITVPSTIEAVSYLCERYDIKVNYNEVSKVTEIVTPHDKHIAQDNAGNYGISLILSQCSLNDLSGNNVRTYIDAVAQRQSYNPVINWIESKPWDGVSRMADLYNTVKVPNGWETQKVTYLNKWTMAAYGMLLNNGELSSRGMLVFQGAQNKGKTYWLQLLTGDMFKYCLDGMSLNPKDKDDVKKYISNWIVELGELDATFTRSDISMLKAFVTQNKDMLRLSYGHTESIFPRRTTPIASVNKEEFLCDDTGNSRYWVLPINDFDLAYMKTINMQQLWAEVKFNTDKARNAHPDILPWFLTPEEGVLLDSHNTHFEQPCEITAIVYTEVVPADELSNELYKGEHMNRMAASKIAERLDIPNNTKNLRIISAAMQSLGYTFAKKKTRQYDLKFTFRDCFGDEVINKSFEKINKY